MQILLDVAEPVDQNVLWLQIPIDDVVLVQVLDGQHQLADVEPRHAFLEPHLLGQLGQQIDSRTVLQNEVDVQRRLEHEENVHDEVVLQLLQDLTLLKHVMQLVSQNELLFVLSLHGVYLFGVLLLHHEDLSERAVPDLLYYIERLQSYIGIIRAVITLHRLHLLNAVDLLG